jgi:hypothetical protein
LFDHPLGKGFCICARVGLPKVGWEHLVSELPPRLKIALYHAAKSGDLLSDVQLGFWHEEVLYPEPAFRVWQLHSTTYPAIRPVLL